MYMYLYYETVIMSSQAPNDLSDVPWCS